jgi:hypothetical protein
VLEIAGEQADVIITTSRNMGAIRRDMDRFLLAMS